VQHEAAAFSRPVQSGFAHFLVWESSAFKLFLLHHSLLITSFYRLQEMESVEIYNRANECLSDFDALVMVQPTADNHRNGYDLNSEEQRARFLIWSANIGIFADGHASLDYRLRDSWEARKLMLDLLGSLKNYLRRGLHRSSPPNVRRVSLMILQQRTPSDWLMKAKAY
jgi:hypothetical protein